MGVNRVLKGMMAVLVLIAASQAQALSPPPPLPIDELTEFYHAMDGDNWHRNDGWLDPAVPVCEWYGITCVTEWPQFGGFQWIGHLRLSNNNLQGELTPAHFELFTDFGPVPIPSRWLDLSSNRITGTLAALPLNLSVVNLAGNDLTGPLPEVSPGSDEILLEELDLAGNDLTGSIPESWAALELLHLNLSDNALEGDLETALAALADENARLWLADNGFEGELAAEWFADLQLESINLCWTHVTINDPDLDKWIADRHLGGPHHICLGRERLPLDLSLSGSWFDPERSGEGFSLMMLDNGAPLIYWFSHVAGAHQMWQFAVGIADQKGLRFRPMLRTRGSFESGFAPIQHPVVRGGQWRLDRVEDDLLHGEHLVAYTGYDLHGATLTWPPMPETALRRDYQPLTRLAGTTCDNQQPHQWISGAWFDPERDGQGFVVEVIENGRGVVYWFTYTPEAHHNNSPVAASNNWQAWMMGDGDFDGNTLVIDPINRPLDTGYGMPDDASGIEIQRPFGSLVLEFHDELNGHIWFDSTRASWHSDDYPIERLARPMLAECE